MPGHLTDARADQPVLDRDALFAPLVGAKGCLLAVSGGPDSMALLHLAATWPAAPPLSVATVDHGLRPGAGKEARDVAAAARRYGLDHVTLTWADSAAGSRLQERARAARYDLLLRAAQTRGADTVVTAHHADDQAETILFRLARGSGLAGLAGMRTRRALGPLALVRPLLGLSKAELVAICENAALAYVEDPSNVDDTFARGRLRQAVPHLEALGLDRPALLRLGRRAARADAALSAAARLAAESLPALRTEATFVVDGRALAPLPDEIRLRILDAEIARVGGAARVRLDRLERLATALQDAEATGRPFAATLGGALLRRAPGGRLTIRRAPPRRACAA